MTDQQKQYANHVIPNSYQTPNIYIDVIMPLLTDSEWRVLSYAMRHILGWREKIETRKGTISLQMFEGGYGPYPGCGLNKGTIIKVLKALDTHGILTKDGDVTKDGQRWQIADNLEQINIQALETRLQNKRSKDKERTKKMLIVLKQKRDQLLSHNTGGVLSHNTASGMSHNTESNPPSNPTINPKDSPSPKSSDGGTQPLDDDSIQDLCIICHSSHRPGRPICKECLKAFNGVAYNKLDFVCTGCGKNIGPNEYHCDPTKNYRCLCIACYTTSQITGDDNSGDLIDSTPLPLGTCSRCKQPCADDCSLCGDCAETLATAMDDDSIHIYGNGYCVVCQASIIGRTNTHYWDADVYTCYPCNLWLQTLNRDDCDSSASDVQLTANMAEVLERLAANEGLLSSHQCYLPTLCDLKMVTEVPYHNKAKGYYWAITDTGRAALEAYRAQQKPTMTELANEILVPTPEDSSGPEQLCPACKIGQCLIDDVSDKTRCNECDTEFDVQRNCSILDHGGSCGDCDIQGDCEIENGNCVLFKRSGPEQLPTSDTPLNDQADAMLAIKNEMKSKHKRKPKSKKSEADKMAEANMWEAVKFVWELDDKAGGLIGKYRQWLLGKIPASKAKQFGEMWYGNQLKDCPATAQEVVAFSHWYRFTKPGMSMPGKGDTLKDNFDAFRGSGKDYEAFLRKAEDTIRDKIPKFSSPGIELAREQALPKEEEEIMEATPELRAEVDRLIAMCGKGGVK